MVARYIDAGSKAIVNIPRAFDFSSSDGFRKKKIHRYVSIYANFSPLAFVRDPESRVFHDTRARAQ